MPNPMPTCHLPKATAFGNQAVENVYKEVDSVANSIVKLSNIEINGVLSESS